MTQSEKIMNHLEEFGSITALEAMQYYGIMRLASRITDLKKAGAPIKVEYINVTNRYGEDVRIARYSLIKDKEA